MLAIGGYSPTAKAVGRQRRAALIANSRSGRPAAGSGERGARQFIAAGDSEFWYTEDHYISFRQNLE
jgi:hypothetical protein